MAIFLVNWLSQWLWNINVRKQAINDKLQGSIAAYLSCGGVVNNQIKNGLLLSLPVNFFTNEYLAKLQAKPWLFRALCACGNQTAKKTQKMHKTTTFLLVTSPTRLFSDVNVSQCNMATYARSGWIFNNQLTTNLPRNLPVKKTWKSVMFWQNYGHEFVPSVFGPPCRPP